jgi:hypothetical protein
MGSSVSDIIDPSRQAHARRVETKIRSTVVQTVPALLQPCTKDRVACGRAHWIGPITDRCDATVLRDWLELGQWEETPLPSQLTGHQLLGRRVILSN